MFGVWFEIRHHKQSWEAFHIARTELDLKHNILLGINAQKLIKSGEPTAAAIGEQMRALRAASQASSCASQHNKPPHHDSTDNLGRYLPGGLGNTCPRYRDNDDDPFSSNTACHRGGNPPEPYGYPGTGNQDNNGGQ